MPPPKRSDIPPPRLLWSRTVAVMRTLMNIKMTDSVTIGQDTKGTITRGSLTDGADISTFGEP